MRGERERVADRVRELLGVARAEQPPRHRWRWDPGRRGAAAVGVAVLVIAAVTLWWVRTSTPPAVPVTGLSAPAGVASTSLGGSVARTSPAPSSPAGTTPPTSTAADSIVVDVAGRVVHPGIYRLPAGARVNDALHAAGGARPGVDTVSINLAAPLQDGQQVVVGVSGAATSPEPVGAARTGSSSAATIVDLNTATLEQLDTLPGVGPVLAQHILDWRGQHGQFSSVDQLNEVSGIGEVKFAELKDLVSL